MFLDIIELINYKYLMTFLILRAPFVFTGGTPKVTINYPKHLSVDVGRSRRADQIKDFVRRVYDEACSAFAEFEQGNPCLVAAVDIFAGLDRARRILAKERYSQFYTDLRFTSEDLEQKLEFFRNCAFSI